MTNKHAKHSISHPELVQGLQTCAVLNSKAFTLIELLVVVLIIGILASVALPQYQKAVDKAHFVKTMAAGDALLQAEKVYFLENGKYTANREELDISVSACVIWVGAEGASDSIMCIDSSYGKLAFRVFLNGTFNRYCVALENDARAKRVCESFTNATGYNMSGNMYYAL